MLGYHFEAPDGTAISRILVPPVLNAGGGVLDGGSIGDSVAAVLTHELLETAVDADINLWVDGPTLPQGSCYAFECADPVQMVGYTIKTSGGVDVLVSNFVTPAYFDPAAPAASPKDWLNTPGLAPFGLLPGGYQIVRGAPGTEQQVFHASVMPPAWRRAHAASRLAHRMLARVA